MPDMEKVIKGLKIHADGCGYRSHHCDAMECPYRYGDESCDIEEMCRDAFELLKEQEDLGTELTNAVELIHKKNKRIEELLKEQEVKTGHWIDTTNTIGFPRCECSECNSEAGAIWMKYCPNCGAKMEGR